MKKTLLAAALLAGFAGVAQAESSVTLYGVVDAGYGIDQTKTTRTSNERIGNRTIKNPVTGLPQFVQGEKLGGFSKRERNLGAQSGVAGDNRWGMMGSEDLGNGTSAIFKLESGFDLGNGRTTNGGRLFGQEAFVGLTGEDWGTFTIGRQYNAGDAFLAPIDPMGTDFGLGGATSAFGNSLSGRFDGVLKYVSPNVEGFQWAVGGVAQSNTVDYEGSLGFDPAQRHQDGKTKNETYGVTTGIGYTYGPLYIGAGYDWIWGRSKADNWDDGKFGGGYNNSISRMHAWNVGLTYDFDVVKLHLLYGQQHGGSYAALMRDGDDFEDGLFNPLNGGDLVAHTNKAGDVVGYADPLGEGYHSQAWLAGISAPVSENGTLFISYQGNHQKNGNSEANWFNGVQLHDADQKAIGHIAAIAYKHQLSKRTAVYATGAYGWSKNNFHDQYDTTDKTKAVFGAIGLQHSF
ncbi:porin [Brackiella oedipodis]|uniref:porin n=1 Tax=Brackiella oedipodis TaxID=124225 RepID=UPI00048B4843|nr:porin [Brackiella oedipodis]